ncbi:MAG: formate dehydrogenase family accessory protein FdhD [Anaerolineae bacterium UTCFX2]|jgi:FdhD protein|nr:formate dehydrogenase accessory sulfurtransferase FdhD [Anaerolineales bacterium]OQY93169.1 MAG: formate dehydrogenase family accessory protein FdhD [Anaerolineae bacterium UTCFX2]
MTLPNEPISYLLVDANKWAIHHAEIIVETPVSLTVNGEVWLTFMCTPVDLPALAVGFLYNEGVIQSTSAIADVRLCPTGDNIDVWLNHSVEKPDNWRKTSGCTGGVTSISPENLLAPSALTQPHNGLLLDARQVRELVSRLLISQDLYQKTGGVHTSVLTNHKGLNVMAEDIGRHNTLDKIAGKCLLDNLDPDPSILLTTGRVSSEMLQKAHRIGAEIVLSRTSPSSLSIALAEKHGITLIGYASRERFRIYAHPERIVLPSMNDPAGIEIRLGQTSPSASN